MVKRIVTAVLVTVLVVLSGPGAALADDGDGVTPAVHPPKCC